MLPVLGSLIQEFGCSSECGLREASLHCINFIIQFCDSSPVLVDSLNMVAERLTDPVPRVRDTAIYCVHALLQSILTKVSILRNIKFNLAYPMGADYDTTAQIFYKGNHKLIYVGFPISIFDDRTGGASHGQILRVLKERRIYFNYKSILFYPRAYYRYFIGLIKKILGSLFPLLVNTYRKKKYMSSI